MSPRRQSAERLELSGGELATFVVKPAELYEVVADDDALETVLRRKRNVGAMAIKLGVDYDVGLIDPRRRPD